MLLYIWWSWSIERIKRDVLHEMSSHLNTSQLCCIFSKLWIELSFFYPQSHGKAVEEQINHQCHNSSFLLFTTWQVLLLCETSLGSKISLLFSSPLQPVLFNFSLSEQCFISVLWSYWRHSFLKRGAMQSEHPFVSVKWLDCPREEMVLSWGGVKSTLQRW